MTLDEFHLIRIMYGKARPFPEVHCPHCQADVLRSQMIVCSRHCEHCGTRVIDPDPEGDDPTPEDVLALPTLDEYIDAVRPYQRAKRWGGRLLVCAVVIGICVIPVVLSSVPGGGPGWLSVAMLGWIFIGIPLVEVVGYAMLKIRSTWNPKLTCQNCHEQDVSESEKIIGSRCCVRCGVRRLLDYPVTGVAPNKLYSLRSVIEHRKVYNRIRRIKSGIIVFIYVVFLVVPIGVAFVSTRLDTFKIISIAILLIVILILIYTMFINLIHALRCSHCRGRLRNHAIIIATKHCYHCGERVIAKPDTLPPEIAHDAG